MMTFSINNGTNIESVSYQINGFLGTQSQFESLISRLQDNIDGFINPSDIRDFIFSISSSTVFKLTTSIGSNVPYIGIDTLNPGDNDLKDKKILLGKKQYQSNDIVTDDLIDSDYDILFYNTKNDNQQQFTTKISLLSGISNFQNSPFIQSQAIFDTTSFSFDFINSNGDINIISQDIEINGFKLPNGLSASEGKVISWNSEKSSMTYDNLTMQLSSSKVLDIFGSPTNINGNDFNFNDDRKCSIEIGDIRLGETFSNFSISEILKRMVYQYLPPISNIKLLPPNDKGYVEIGLIPNAVLEFSIFKRTLNTNTATLLNMIPGTFPAITTQGYSSVNATASGLITSPLDISGVAFSITVSDGVQSTNSSTNIRGIYPYFHGFSSQESISNISQLIKLVESKSDKNIIIQPGSGFFYFIYDSDYPNLIEILDQDNSVVVDFDLSTQTLSSPTGLWVNKEFKVYRINSLSTSIPIIFKFKY